ncbi:transporter substrate-binding domain-containing protein [Kitasatospora sp. NPDC058170]|uniref:transporter substrate-binding domain-containing protein n=1 Tax=Kitasatospora sp. NPDC058170 TaxID=3346364 RepID=UPI0036DAE71E
MNAARRLRPLAVAVVLSLAPAAACSSGPDRPAPFDRRIQIGFKSAMPGMSDQLSNGIFRGFEPRLVERVLGDAGVQYTSVLLAATTWEDALDDGNTNHNGVDLVVADISNTDERKGRFDLVGPYLKTRLGALMPAAHPTVVRRQEDLTPLRVCTVANTTARSLIEKEVKPRVPVDGQSHQQCLERLDDGSADVFVSDYLVMRGIALNLRTAEGKPRYAVAEGKFGKEQSLVAALPKGHGEACRWLRGRIGAYLNSQAWVDELRSSFSFGPDDTDANLRGEFQPVTSTADGLCDA